jgi:hypothetical protein
VSSSDLALLCSNCHRMIHANPPWPTPAELGEIIRRQAEGLESRRTLRRERALDRPLRAVPPLGQGQVGGVLGRAGEPGVGFPGSSAPPGFLSC